jgi:hypothetical protein
MISSMFLLFIHLSTHNGFLNCVFNASILKRKKICDVYPRRNNRLFHDMEACILSF